MVRFLATKRFILFITILTLIISTPVFLLAGQYQVFRVVDGDTFTVKHGSIKITVRLVGIDAPENSNNKRKDGQPFSRQSTQHLSGLVLKKTVDVKSYGADRNGRTLGEVFLLDGKNINMEMIKVGLAEVYRGNLHPVSTWNHTGRQREKPKLQNGGCGYSGTNT